MDWLRDEIAKEQMNVPVLASNLALNFGIELDALQRSKCDHHVFFIHDPLLQAEA
jgi:hypothetical protein